MPVANVRGVSLNYEIVGDSGPWLALMPGGRRGYREFLNLSRKIAAQGFRVLLHDRRNCGASEVVFDDSDAEDAIWADDLHELLRQLDALPAFVGGSSSGFRTSLLFYLRHRKDVKGLLLMRVTGGPSPPSGCRRTTTRSLSAPRTRAAWRPLRRWSTGASASPSGPPTARCS